MTSQYLYVIYSFDTSTEASAPAVLSFHFSYQYSDIDARLKSLQEDYTTQQENHYKELETKANQLTTVGKSVVELKDEVAQLQDQLITARGEVSSLKEQVHRITIVMSIDAFLYHDPYGTANFSPQ